MIGCRTSLRRGIRREAPSNLNEWLDKWEPRVMNLRRRGGRPAAERAGGALDELEYLLTRTVGNQVSE